MVIMAFLDEKALIEAAQAGDLSAFNELVVCYQDQAYNVAYRLLNDADSAADAVQESFFKVYRRIEQYRGGSFRGVGPSHRDEQLLRHAARQQAPLCQLPGQRHPAARARSAPKRPPQLAARSRCPPRTGLAPGSRNHAVAARSAHRPGDVRHRRVRIPRSRGHDGSRAWHCQVPAQPGPHQGARCIGAERLLPQRPVSAGPTWPTHGAPLVRPGIPACPGLEPTAYNEADFQRQGAA